MAFKYGVFLMFIAQICTTLAVPSCVCAKNYAPVCGSDGKTYGSECLLECAATKSATSLTIAKHAPCSFSLPEQCVCTFNYLPVCGNDGQTYSNECQLNCHKSRFNQLLKVDYSGACRPSRVPVSVCPAIEIPVCGSDGITYGNDCMLNGATASNPQLRIAHEGPCASQVQRETFRQ